MKAQLDSSDEDCSGDEGEERQGNETPITASSSGSTMLYPEKKADQIDTLVELIEEQYVKRGAHHTASQAIEEVGVGEEEDRLPLGFLWLKGRDWLLWRVKCTPGQEYLIVYELMMRHNTLSDELQSAFFNPRDVGYIYLEANFTKSSISSLQEVLREFSDLKLYSLGIVPEADLKRCLTIGSSFKQVFASGQWVSINRGLYRGDIGLVVEDLREEDSTRGVQVLVVPCLDYSDQDMALLHPSKRKHHLGQVPPYQIYKGARAQLLRRSTTM
ncbi:hypothetical protein D9757_015349 [Collybiopsis confluens]|uniref:NGN domain-containing protein n=1 Tax=Collybiopsis confluens TaxID=2823264 RepID=A0A8H5FKH8_9AGAR|nr:hypothetical protein D9757_015349 [Collybiopsis confluens]